MSSDNQGYLPPTLVRSIDAAQAVARDGIITSRQLSRGNRERLQKAGYLRPLMRGWYHFATPWSTTPVIDEPAVFRQFLVVYLADRLGDRWCFSATTSLQLMLDHQTIPSKVVVLAESGSTTTRDYTGGIKLTIYPDPQRFPPRVETQAGLQFMPPQLALVRLPLDVWQEQPELVTSTVGLIYDWDQMAWTLMREGRLQAAQRLVNWLVDHEKLPLAELIHQRMLEGGFRCNLPAATASAAEPQAESAAKSVNVPEAATDPTVRDILRAATEPVPGLETIPSATVQTPGKHQRPADPGIPSGRALLDLWVSWRPGVLEIVGDQQPPIPAFLPHLAAIQTSQIEDTIASLALSNFSITHNHVLNTLAEPERAASAAGWPHLQQDKKLLKPDHSEPLPGEHDPMAVVSMQGYVDALRLVKRSIVRLLENDPLDKVLRQEMRGWYSALMRPSAEAGLMDVRQLTRYRTSDSSGPSICDQAPPASDIIICMETLVQLISLEPGPAARALLALLGLSWISPWTLGNGRMARLLMNVLRSGAGLSWLLPTSLDPEVYQQALASAFNDGNGQPLSRFFAATAFGEA